MALSFRSLLVLMNQYIHDREQRGPVMGKKGDNFFIFVLQEIKWKPRKWGICDHWRLKLFIILRLDRHLNISFHTQYTQIFELETLVMFREEGVIFSASFIELFGTITERAPLLPGSWVFTWPWMLIKPPCVIYRIPAAISSQRGLIWTMHQPDSFWKKFGANLIKHLWFGVQSLLSFSFSFSSLRKEWHTGCMIGTKRYKAGC